MVYKRKQKRGDEMNSKKRGCGFRWLTALLLLLGLAASHAQTLTIGGTGTGLGTMRLLAAEFARASGTSIVVVPNLGSSGGLKAVAQGALDIAVSSRPLKADEARQGLVAVEYGRTPFVIATSKQGAPGFRNIGELVDLYAGRRTAWPDGEPIRLILRPAHDGDSVLLASFSPAMNRAVQDALAKPGMVLAPTDQDAANAIERTPGAVGTISLALIIAEKRNLNVLSINGVMPTPKAVADGSYPYYKAMYLARQEGGREQAARFLEFMSSRQAQRILMDTGHWLPNAKSAR